MGNTKIVLRASAALAGFFLTGSCSQIPLEPGQALTWSVQLGSVGECRSWIETTYRLSSNEGGKLNVGSAAATKALGAIEGSPLQEKLAPLDEIRVAWKPSSFAPQRDPNLCWAASLSMAFAHAGIEHNQAKFSNVFREMCGRENDRPASLNQIIYALTKVHRGEGQWLSEPNRGWLGDSKSTKAAGPFMWTNVTWSTGGVYSIMMPLQIVQHLKANRLVILGYGSHVVVLIGAFARLGGVALSDGTRVIESDARIDNFIVIDPLDGGREKLMNADQLLKSSRFAFAVIP